VCLFGKSCYNGESLFTEHGSSLVTRQRDKRSRKELEDDTSYEEFVKKLKQIRKLFK